MPLMRGAGERILSTVEMPGATEQQIVTYRGNGAQEDTHCQKCH